MDHYQILLAPAGWERDIGLKRRNGNISLSQPQIKSSMLSWSFKVEELVSHKNIGNYLPSILRISHTFFFMHMNEDPHQHNWILLLKVYINKDECKYIMERMRKCNHQAHRNTNYWKLNVNIIRWIKYCNYSKIDYRDKGFIVN